MVHLPVQLGKEYPAAIGKLLVQLQDINPAVSELGISLEALHWNNKTSVERGKEFITHRLC